MNREDAPYVVMPNPFYQIYEGATLLAGAKPISSTVLKKMATSAILMPVPCRSLGKNGAVICLYPR